MILINLFLLLRKCVYPYEYMDESEKLIEIFLEKEELYTSKQRVFNDFKIKNLGEQHDLYLKSEALLLAVYFENF